jgi:hypothetical protein
MGSLLALIMADFYMEYSEEAALKTVQHKQTHWFRYVDDTFVVWPNGEGELQKFLLFLNRSSRILNLL